MSMSFIRAAKLGFKMGQQARRKPNPGQVDRLVGAGKLAARGPYGKTAGAQSYQRIAEAELEAQSQAAQKKRK
jgi:hypothetical protein